MHLKEKRIYLFFYEFQSNEYYGGINIIVYDLFQLPLVSGRCRVVFVVTMQTITTRHHCDRDVLFVHGTYVILCYVMRNMCQI